MKCIDKIVDWLCKKNAIEEQDSELYVYAIHSLIMTIAPILMCVLIGAFMKAIIKSIIMIIPFILIRKYSGGFHAGKLWICLIFSTLILGIGIIIVKKFNANLYINILFAISSVLIIILSPIDSKNRRLNHKEKKSYKKTAAIEISIIDTIYFILVLLNKHEYLMSIAVGIFMVLFLQIICIPGILYKKIIECKHD